MPEVVEVEDSKDSTAANGDDDSSGLQQEQPQGEPVTGEEQAEEENPIKDERSPVFESRLEKAAEFRESGKAHFRAGRTNEALSEFERGLYQVDFDELSYNFELMDKHRTAVDEIRVPLWLNAAACLLLDKKFHKVLEYCEKILASDNGNVKALYRRAKAKEGLGKFDEAIEDLEKAYTLANGDAEVSKALGLLRKKVEKSQKEADDVFRRAFQRQQKKNQTTTTVSEPSTLAWIWELIVRLFRQLMALLGLRPNQGGVKAE